MPLIHALETQRVKTPLRLEQRGALPFWPESFARAARIYAARRAALQSLEVETQPLPLAHAVDIGPFAQLDTPLATPQLADKILVMPARKDDQFARRIVHARTYDRGVPLPTILAHERRIGLHGILVEVIQNEAVDTVPRQRALTPDRQQTALMPDDLDLVRRAHIPCGLAAALDARFGKQLSILLRLDYTLHAAVEFRCQRGRIGCHRHFRIGRQAQHVCWQQGARAHALAVLRRHRDHQAAHTPRGKHLQQTVIYLVERLHLEKRIYRDGKVGKRRHERRLSGRHLR